MAAVNEVAERPRPRHVMWPRPLSRSLAVLPTNELGMKRE